MILVTGAGGTVGSALLDELHSMNHKPRAAHYSAGKVERATAAGRDAVRIDFTDPATIREALAGIDTVFLLSTGVHGQVEGETNVVNVAKAAGVKRIVKLSVWGAAEEQFSFATMHRAAERVVEESGLAWTFLRPNSFMQNFVNYMRDTIKADGAIYEPAADATIAHIDVRDIARVAARVLTSDGHEGNAYELSGPQALSYGEAAETLSRVLGRPIRYVAISDEAARAGMIAAGIPDFYADYVVDLNRYYRTGAASQVSRDVRRITGREPVSFDQFARDYADALR